MKRYFKYIGIFSVFFIITQVQSSSPYTLLSFSVNSGDAWLTSQNYEGAFILGQAISNKSSSSSHNLILGFLHPPYAPLYHFLLGDVNNDGQVNALDVEYLSQYLYFNGPTPAVPAQADVNQDHEINDADLVALTHLLWH